MTIRPPRGSRDPHAAVARELAGRHPRLARLVQVAHPIRDRVPDPRPLSELAVGTVVSQLVSTAAARTIQARLLEAHGSVDGVIAWAMAAPDDAPPSHGLSRAKRRAIAGWGRFLAVEGDPRARWRELEAEALLAEIQRLKGFGRWSAEMFAIFGFGHPRIWPEGDAGVQRVMRELFPRMKPPGIRRLVAGHETHVALCCWSVLDSGRLALLRRGAG